MDKEESKIFISYSRDDKDFALRLAEDLRAADVEIWIDQLDIPAGVRWDDAVEEALDSCKSFMVILSPVSVKSDDVKDEIACALDAGKQIIPVFYKECKIPIRIRRLNYIDFSSDYSSGKTKLIEVLKKVQPEKAEIKTKQEVIHKEKVVSEKVVKKEPVIKKKWIKPVGISLAIIILVVIGYLIVHFNLFSGLSINDVKAMLNAKGYYEVDWNPNGTGIDNKYDLQNINGDSVVFDETTKLMWQKSGSTKAMEFKDAKKWIKKINQKRFAGFNDWRLPTLEEAMSLVESEKKELYIDLIFDSNQSYIWTADPAQGTSLQWVVYFNTGGCYYYGFSSYVRAVRFGQSSPE